MSIPRNTEMTKRLLRVFDSADSHATVSGINWYREAMHAVNAIAARNDVERDAVAEVVSALSPRMHWSRNLTVAETVIQAWGRGDAPSTVRGALQANVLKAFAILAGDTGILGGLKTQNFARNLKGDTDAVTVDAHAIRAATGIDRDSVTPRQYRQIATSYIRAANRVGLTPREFQAVIWVAERGRAS